MKYSITIKSKDDVMKLNEAATKENYPISVSTESLIVDARSLLALFALIGRQVSIVAPDHIDPDEFICFVKRISK